MHESSLARQSSRRPCSQRARRERGSRPHGARLDRRDGGALARRASRFHFAAHARGTIAEGARLELELVHVEARCRACGDDLRARASRPPLPDCGSTDGDAARPKRASASTRSRSTCRDQASPCTCAGVVQGVGFRPFVYGAATRARARGLGPQPHRRRPARGARGPPRPCATSSTALRREPPPAARDRAHRGREVALGAATLASASRRARPAPPSRPTLPADLATCAECLRRDRLAGARRHRYPFTNCTRCGPRYTSSRRCPTIARARRCERFPLCAACAAEYADPARSPLPRPADRLPACGPTLRLLGRRRALTRARRRRARRARRGAARGTDRRAARGSAASSCSSTRPAAAAVADAARAQAPRGEAVRRDVPDARRGARRLRASATPRRACSRRPRHRSCSLRRRRRRQPRARRSPMPSRRGNPRLGALLPYTPLHHLLARRRSRARSSAPAATSPRSPCASTSARRSRASAGHRRPVPRPRSPDRATGGRLGGARRARRAAGAPPRARLRAAARCRSAADAPCVLALGAQLKSTVALARRRRGGREPAPRRSAHASRGARSSSGRWRTCCASSPPARRASPAISIPTTPRRASPSGWPPAGTCRSCACSITTPTSRPAMAEHGLSRSRSRARLGRRRLGTDGTLWGGEALVVDGAGFRARGAPAALSPAGRRAGDARAAARRPRGPACAWRRRRGPRRRPGLRMRRASCSACWRAA